MSLDLENLTSGEIAQFFGKTTRWVNQLAKTGIFHRKTGYRYDLKQCLQAYIKNIESRADETQKNNIDEYEARIKAAKAQSAELDLLVKKGKYISAEDTEKIILSLVTRTKNRLLPLSHKLAPRVVITDDTAKVEEIIDEAIRRALRELANTAVKCSSGSNKRTSR